MRNDPPLQADERATLSGFLQYQRETLAMKCAGLTVQQLRTRAVPPSNLSLLGLVRHLADVERGWFRNVFNGEGAPKHWDTDGFDVDDADVDEAFRAWHEEADRARAIVAAAASLDRTGRWQDTEFSLRYIVTHLIEEYARHNGHADLLRERIDGSTGE